MDTYNPLSAPDPEEWLALDESERIDLIAEYHMQQGVEMPNNEMHALIHAVIEYQVALGGDYPVKDTLDRLISEGLDRHEAVHAIGSILIKHMWEVGQGANASDDFSEDYFDEVRQLTVEQWLDEFG